MILFGKRALVYCIYKRVETLYWPLGLGCDAIESEGAHFVRVYNCLEIILILFGERPLVKFIVLEERMQTL
jgi:hypothetical protein